MTTATNPNATLFAKIAAVMGEVRTLEKTGRNQFDKYDYVTADTIATRIGSAMAAHKLAVLPAILSVETSEYATKSGGTNFRTVVHMEMTLACGDSGAIFTMPWYGEAIDRSDKSISKAAVSAVKYFLLKTFLLAGGEDDADASSPTLDTPATQAPARRNTPQPDVDMGMPQDNPWESGDKKTPNPRGWFHAEIAKTFPPEDIDDARHWFVRRYSTKVTPDNVRESTNDLSDDELLSLVDTLKEHRTASRNAWLKHKAQAAALAA